MTTTVPDSALEAATWSSMAFCAAHWIELSIVVSIEVPATGACSLMPAVGISVPSAAW